MPEVISISLGSDKGSSGAWIREVRAVVMARLSTPPTVRVMSNSTRGSSPAGMVTVSATSGSNRRRARASSLPSESDCIGVVLLNVPSGPREAVSCTTLK